MISTFWSCGGLFSSRLEMNESAPGRDCDSVGAIGRSQLSQNVLYMSTFLHAVGYLLITAAIALVVFTR